MHSEKLPALLSKLLPAMTALCPNTWIVVHLKGTVKQTRCEPALRVLIFGYKYTFKAF